MTLDVEVLGLARRDGETLLLMRPLKRSASWVNVRHVTGEPTTKLYPGRPYWTRVEIADEHARRLGWLSREEA